MGLEPTGMAASNIDSLWIDPIDYQVQIKKTVQILHRRNIKVSIFNHQLCTLPKELWPFAKQSISEWKNIFMPECEKCIKKTVCGGFFQSAHFKRSRGIIPILN
jgi:hypothetical protein